MTGGDGDDATAALAAGLAAERNGDLATAVEHFRQAAILTPENARAYLAISQVELRRCSYIEAEAAAREAILRDPALHAPQLNLAKALSNTGRLEAALALYRKVLARTDEAPSVFSEYLFVLIHSSRHSREAIFAEHVRFGEGLAAKLPPPVPHANDPDPDRRLKLAFVSADVGRHIAAIMLEAVLRSHDHSQFEVFIYDNAQAATKRTLPRECFDHWLEVADLGDAALAERIRADGIDVLVDLSGHTGGNRLPVFARKPAPVQASWLGYPFTTGVQAIDYRICHERQIGPETASLFAEEPYVLPGGALAFMPPEDPPPAAPPSVANGYVTFGSVNALDKVDGASLQLWAEVLRSIPDSRMMLKAHGLHDVRLRKRLAGGFAHLGVHPGRLIFESGSPARAFRESLARMDIALDTTPYTGGSTTRQTLWMGVPVITLEGVTLYERFSGAILRELDLAECVATDPKGYVAAAVALAGDPARLAEFRRDLRPRMQASALCDTADQARELEGAYREMWRRWCARQAAA